MTFLFCLTCVRPQALAVGGVGSIVRVLTARKTVWWLANLQRPVTRHSWSSFWTSVFVWDFFSNCSSFYFFSTFWISHTFLGFQSAGCQSGGKVLAPHTICLASLQRDLSLRRKAAPPLNSFPAALLALAPLALSSLHLSSGRVGLIQRKRSCLPSTVWRCLFFFYSCQSCVWFSLIRGRSSYVDSLYVWNNKRIKSRSWTLIFSASVQSFYKTTVVVLLTHLNEFVFCYHNSRIVVRDGTSRAVGACREIRTVFDEPLCEALWASDVSDDFELICPTICL